jgi:hypothetical protein
MYIYIVQYRELFVKILVSMERDYKDENKFYQGGEVLIFKSIKVLKESIVGNVFFFFVKK